MTIEPPEAKKIPSPRTFHGDTVVDEYAWLADKDDPDTIDYLRAENEYTDELTDHLSCLRDQLLEEIKGAHRCPGLGARSDLRGDQGAHPGERPVRPGAQGRLVALLADGRGQAVRG